MTSPDEYGKPGSGIGVNLNGVGGANSLGFIGDLIWESRAETGSE